MGESGCPGRTLENQKKMCLQQITGLSVILLIFTTALGGSLVPPFYRWEDQGSERWGRWSDSHDQWLVAVGSDSRPTDFQSWAGRALFFSKHYSINRSLLIGNLHYTSSQWIVYRLHTRVLPWSFLGLSMLLQVDSSVVFVVDVQSLVHLQMNHFPVTGCLDYSNIGGCKSLLQWNLCALGSTPSVDAPANAARRPGLIHPGERQEPGLGLLHFLSSTNILVQSGLFPQAKGQASRCFNECF